MHFIKQFFPVFKKTTFQQQLENILGIKPTKKLLYFTALTHKSIKDAPDENNERLEYLGDAILGCIVADYLFKRYPYKGEGFLTEMRSKMVNRQQLNDIAIKIGLKKITLYNKLDNSLRNSQIFGNTLEAIVGAIYLDKGYKKTEQWVLQQIVLQHMFVDDLESIDINLKNKLIGWASKNGKALSFEVAEEHVNSGRRTFIINAILEGEILSQGIGYNKKDASQIAAQNAIEKLGL
ncbi:MAG: ribonuclease III [Chitinophagaceae bacterium]|nr:ribonuclease III [Chitinophagaceae bacterium]MCW5904489.1 ribonuclease III [Chitinophagaceae bacterium]